MEKVRRTCCVRLSSAASSRCEDDISRRDLPFSFEVLIIHPDVLSFRSVDESTSSRADQGNSWTNDTPLSQPADCTKRTIVKHDLAIQPRWKSDKMSASHLSRCDKMSGCHPQREIESRREERVMVDSACLLLSCGLKPTARLGELAFRIEQGIDPSAKPHVLLLIGFYDQPRASFLAAASVRSRF